MHVLCRWHSQCPMWSQDTQECHSVQGVSDPKHSCSCATSLSHHEGISVWVRTGNIYRSSSVHTHDLGWVLQGFWQNLLFQMWGVFHAAVNISQDVSRCTAIRYSKFTCTAAPLPIPCQGSARMGWKGRITKCFWRMTVPKQERCLSSIHSSSPVSLQGAPSPPECTTPAPALRHSPPALPRALFLFL